MNKKARSKTLLKSKEPFKWVFMDNIPEMYPNFLTTETTFSDYVLIVNACSKIPKHYGTEIITTEEVMYKLYMFQAILGKIDWFGW